MVDPDAGTDVWTTIRGRLRQPVDGEEALRQATEGLEGLAALLAERDDVGGVETRDPFSIAEGPDFTPVEQPELVVYTTPVAAEAVRLATASLADALGLALLLSVEDHAGDAWRDVWKRHYRSLRFFASAGSSAGSSPGPAGSSGPALMIRPSWIPREADDPALEVVLDPGRAFGTGLHESTRLCLQLLVDLAGDEDAPPPRVLLDLGCGSGILALAALRLFPTIESAWLADHDPEAIATSEENATINGLRDRIDTAVVDLLAEATPALPERRADLLLANIRPSVLIPAAPRIAGALAARGETHRAVLILSGILDDEAEAVRAAYAELDEVGRRREGGWTALALRNPSPSP